MNKINQEKYKRIVLFDGDCNLCNHYIQFIINNSEIGSFYFASLQSEIGKSIMRENLCITKQYDCFNSIILIDKNSVCFSESTAILKIFNKLNRPWSFLYIFIIIPSKIRNMVYKYISRNRHIFFLNKRKCLTPTPEISDLFL